MQMGISYNNDKNDYCVHTEFMIYKLGNLCIPSFVQLVEMISYLLFCDFCFCGIIFKDR